MLPKLAEGAAFRYKALRPDGTRESGQLAASSARAALETLRGRGLTHLAALEEGRAQFRQKQSPP